MEATPLTRVQNAAKALERAEAKAEKARQELHKAIRAAYDAGESAATIARVLGVTRQYISQIIRAEARKGANR